MNRVFGFLILLSFSMSPLAQAGSPPTPGQGSTLTKAQRDAQAAQDAADAAAAAATPLDVIQATKEVGDATLTVTRNADGTVNGSVSNHNCDECVAKQVEIQVGDSSKLWKSSQDILKSLGDSADPKAKEASKDENNRVKWEAEIKEKIEACEIAPESKVDNDGPHPIKRIVRWSSSSKTYQHISKEDIEARKDRAAGDEPEYADAEADNTNKVFSKLDQCKQSRFEADDTDPALKQRFANEMVQERYTLAEKQMNGTITVKESMRLETLNAYLGKMSGDQNYKAILFAADRAYVMQKNAMILKAITDSGSSPQAAAAAMQPGGALSEASLSVFRSALGAGKTLGSDLGNPNSFNDINLTNLKKMTDHLVSVVAKNNSTTGGSSTGDMYADAYKSGGGSIDQIYADAQKRAREIARGLEGHLNTSDEYSLPKDIYDPSKDQKRLQSPANFVQRGGANCMNATAYASQLNTQNSVANSVPQACQTQQGVNLGTSAQNYNSTNSSSSGANQGFHLMPRTSS